MAKVQPKIAGAGICCLDYIVASPRVPWGDTAFVTDFQVQGGGLVATALVACARLGAECGLFSLLGDDQIGEQIVAELVAEGVDCAGVPRIPGGASPFSFVHVDDSSGDRTIFHRSGAGLRSGTSLVEFPREMDYQAAVVDEVYPELALAAAKLCREKAIPVVADLIPSPGGEELLRYVDVLIAPRHYAREIGRENDLDGALDAIHALGPKIAVITLGADGWVYSDGTDSGRGEAFAVDVVDTTGAGDTFHGAFAYGLALGWTTRRCCEFASAVAAIKCTKPGGRTGLPSLPQAMDFLKERSKLEW